MALMNNLHQNKPPQFLNSLKYLKIFGEVFLDWNLKKSEFNIEESMML